MGALTSPTPAVHEINGMKVFHDEPYPFLDQAHALALMTDQAIRDEGGNGPPNDDLLSAAVRGVATLIELASLGLAVMDAKQDARRAGGQA